MIEVDCLVNLLEYNLAFNGGQGRVAQQISRLLASYAEHGKRRIVFSINERSCGAFEEWLGESRAMVVPALPPDGFSPLLKSFHPRLLVSPLLGMTPFDRDRYPGVPHIAIVPETLVLEDPQ